MTLPIYASPEQFMRDRSEYARKGIARGRSVVITTYAGGVLFVAENPSPSLHKVSEIYDRIAFAGVGRYNEFENLRTAGIRLADVRGFSYDRRDVTGRWLANAYAQTLGSIFSEHQKPFEVELCVAEVGPAHANGDLGPTLGDQLYRISYDGSIVDETTFVVMGGETQPVSAALGKSYRRGWSLADALQAATTALGAGGEGAPRILKPAQLEVAVLDRSLPGRTFRRVEDTELGDLLEKRTQPQPHHEASAPGSSAQASASEDDPVRSDPAEPDGASAADSDGGAAGQGEPPGMA